MLTTPTIVSGLLLILSLLVTPFFFRKTWLNPPVIFFAVWFLNFIIYEMDHFIHFYDVTLSSKTEFLFVLSFIGFFLGSLSMALTRALPKKDMASVVLPQKEYSYLIFLEKLSIVLFVLVLISVFGKYIILIYHYGNPLVHLGEIRVTIVSGDFVYPKILQFFSIFRYVLILNLAVLLAFTAEKKIYISWMIVAVVLSIFTDVAVAGRGGILNTFLFLIGTLLAAYLAKGIKLKAKHYFWIISSVVVLMILFGSILYLRHHDKNFFQKFGISSYYYFTGTIPAVESFIQHPLESTYPGFFTFSGLYQAADKAAGLFGANFLSSQDNQTVYVPISHKGPFNSAGHLAFYYGDWREFGVLIFPYLLGLLSVWLFFRVYDRPTILSIQMCGIVTAFIIFTIRGTMTSGASIWFTIFIILIQYLLFEWRRNFIQHAQHI